MEVAPKPSDETGRLRALRRANILDTPPEEAFDELTALARRVCGTPIALMSLIDADRQWFKSRVGLDARETPREHAFCAHAILDPESTMVVPDASGDRRFHDNPLVTGEPRIRFYAGAPLQTRDGYALGTLCVIDDQARDPSEVDIDGLRVLARQAMRLLEQRRQDVEIMRSELQRSRHELRTLKAELAGLSRHRDAIEQSTLEGLGVFTCDPATGDLQFSRWNGRMRAITGYTLHEINCLGWFNSVCEVRGHRQGETSLAERMSAGERFRNERTSLVDAAGAVRDVGLSTEDLWTLGGQRHCLMVLDDRTEHRQLEEQVRLGRIDELSGVRNRRAFLDDAAEILGSARGRGPVALAYLDVDDLKLLNDAGGHSAGDRVLKCVGQTLLALTRSTDVVGRLGGDEFALLLPDTDGHHARRLFTRMHQAVAGALGEPGKAPGVTMGVALYPSSPDSVEQALQDADRIMYEVKHSGKGAVSFRDMGAAEERVDEA